MNQLKALDNMIATKQKALDQIIARKKKEISPLIKRREDLVTKLYNHMKTNNLTYYQGLHISDVAPKPKKEKKEKISRSFQIAKLRQMGIRNPEEALREIGV